MTHYNESNPALHGMPLCSFLLFTVSSTMLTTGFCVGLGRSKTKGANGTSWSVNNFSDKISPLGKFPNPSFFDS